MPETQTTTTATPPAATATAGTPPAASTATPPTPTTALGTSTPSTEGSTGSTTALGGPPKAELELKMPDGVTLEPPVLEKYKGLAQELGLDEAKAQKGLEVLVAARASALEGLEKQIHEEAAAQGAKWLAEAKADPELGGAKWDATVATASKAVERFGGNSLREVLNRTGLGNNPAVIRAFYLAGKAISEDSISGKGSGEAATPASDPDAVLRKLYPTMFQDKKE